MLNSIKDFFHYTRSERNGLLVLIALLLLLAIIPTIYNTLKVQGTSDFSEFEREIALFQNNLNQSFTKKPTKTNVTTDLVDTKIININKASKVEWATLGLHPKQINTILNYQKKGGKFYQVEDLKKIYGIDESTYESIKDYLMVESKPTKKQDNFKNKPAKKTTPIQLVFFNPNTADIDLLQQVGIPEKTANIMINYRNKGGTFRRKEDLLKIFGMTTALYQRLLPYLIVEQVPRKSRVDSSFQALEKTVEVEPVVEAIAQKLVEVDVNQSGQTEWENLSGIGPYYAKQILRFRDRLGGFSSIEQIGTTYGLPDSLFQQLKPQLKISPIFRKININTCSVDQLKVHPYLKWKQAKVIINYRQKHGPFQTIKDLEHVLILDQTLIQKLAPYFSFEIPKAAE